MHRRQPLPRLWLMTDERQGKALWRALSRLPRGAGIVFRHKSLSLRERRLLFGRVRAEARRRGLLLLLAGSPSEARSWGADGVHLRAPHPALPGQLRSAPAHDACEIVAAERAGAQLLFVSPVFATRSHPGARTLGPLRLASLARRTKLPVVALGGMNAARARRLHGLGLHGWAAIDAWGETGAEHPGVTLTRSA